MRAWNAPSLPERILAVRLDTLGDVLMTGPAIRALGEGGAHVTLLTSSRGEAAAKLLEVDEVMVYDAPWLKATAAREDSRLELDFIETLRSHRFDAAVIFTTYTQNPLPTALTLYLADIPLRLAHCRENPYQLLTHWVRDVEEVAGVRHEVRRQLDLVASVGYEVEDERMRVEVSERSRGYVDELLAPLELHNWIAVHPGASAESRRYPPEKFALACDMLARLGLQLVFTGSQNERELITEIQARMSPSYSSFSHNLAGGLELPQLAALLERAPLLLANNTGPVHLAAAVGTSVVDLYALTNAQHTPWGVPSRVLFEDVPCRFCLKSVCPEGHNGCLHWVEPERVAAAVRELLETSSPLNYAPVILSGVGQTGARQEVRA